MNTIQKPEALQEIAELQLIAQYLRIQHRLTTPGKWTKGSTTHHTVSERPDHESYRVAEFRHANDAAFCDLAHRHVPRLLDELEAQHARIADLEAQLSAIGAGGVEPLRKAQAVPGPAGEYPPLPKPARPGEPTSPYPAAQKSYWTEAQIYEAIDSDRAMRAQAAQPPTQPAAHECREALAACINLLKKTPKITRDMYVGNDRQAWGVQAKAVLDAAVVALNQKDEK